MTNGRAATIAYYVSGHGFGHARRSRQVSLALTGLRPDIRMVVRTAAPAKLFDGIANTSVEPPIELFDPGVVERDTLTIDPAASVERLAEVLSRRDRIVEGEAEFLRGVGAGLAVSDIPFLAADAAEAARVPAIAVGNFTWDWIFEPFAGGSNQALIEQIRRSHDKFEAILHLPLGHEVTRFRKVVEVPLLASPAKLDRATTLRRLGLDEKDARPRVLIALRGGFAPEAMIAAAGQSPEVQFLVNQAIENPPENLRVIDSWAEVDFSDILGACDASISKLGYGILSDCIANRTALLYPPRTGFREDEISRKVCPRYMRMREISREDFAAGNWRRELTLLLGQAPAPNSMLINGDRVIAELVSESV